MKSFKQFLALSFTALILVSCGKDKNVEDFQRDQLQQSITRISAISGSYSGTAISKIDGNSLGVINLKFQAKTDVQTVTSNIANQQNATVSGALTFEGFTAAVINFDNGFYDDVTGDFQVTVQIPADGGTISKLSLAGQISGNQWRGSIEIKGQPEYGAVLNLVKNQAMSNTSKLEIGGSRMQQIKRSSLNYNGEFLSGNEVIPFSMGFIGHDNLPEQSFYNLFSPVRRITVICDFTRFKLTFANASLDDQMGTLKASNPTDDRGVVTQASLNCQKFDSGKNIFGYDCQIQTPITTLNLHLGAK